MEEPVHPLVAAALAVVAYGVEAADFRQHTDQELLGVQKAAAKLQRELDPIKTRSAGEVAHRSRRELGHAGLAAREGFRTPAELLQTVTGATAREANQLVTLGTIAGETEATQELIDSGATEIAGEPVVVPWEAPIVDALAAGRLSADQADSLRRGLGTPSESISPDQLHTAVLEILAESGHLAADRLFREARQVRELLDEAGIPVREAELVAARSLKTWTRRNGMVRAVWDLDPEGGALLHAAIDPLTSPRRGGPRMVDPEEQARAQQIIDDPRSTEQIASDGLLNLVRLGTSADPNVMYQRNRSLVKLIVIQDSLNNDNDNGGTSQNGAGTGETGTDGGGGKGSKRNVTVRNGVQAGEAGRGRTGQNIPDGAKAMVEPIETGHDDSNQASSNQASERQTGGGDPGGEGWPPGFAVIEGNPVPVSLSTAKRLVCSGDTQELLVTPQGGPLDLGRTRRLFDRRQHEALAVRDGGCMWPECGKPPSWSEAHHINEYERDRGNTDVADGVCLCRFHHLTLHNNGWQIVRTDSDYWLIPPATLDPKREPIPMPSKNLLIRKMRKQADG